MLKRIEQIQNVGTFSDCAARQIELSKINLIYGRNTYGKSTLGDIFTALQNNDAALITSRASIPATNKPASVKFQFGTADKTSTITSFKGGKWRHSQPQHQPHLKVFNEAFYHDHVFAGRKFTRDTKVNFSQFILGEQGVALAKQIDEKNKAKRTATNRQKTLVADAFADIDDIEGFLKLVPTGDVFDLSAKQQQLAALQHQLKQQQNNATAIKQRQNLASLAIDIDILAKVDEVNDIFATTLATLHNEAKLKLAEHISHHPSMANDHTNERWLRQGVKYHNGKSCQFCGQDFNQSALDLLASYSQCFDEEFERHADYVKASLTLNMLQFDPFTEQSLYNAVMQHGKVVQSYPELQGYGHFDENQQTLAELQQALQTLLAQIITSCNDINRLYNQSYALKQANPHKEEPIIDAKDLTALIQQFNDKLIAYNTVVVTINDEILAFKVTLEHTVLLERLTDVTTQLQAVERMLMRFNKQQACDEYNQLSATITALDNAIPALQTQLDNEQNDYLNRYFDSINDLFTALGSHDFTLQRASTNRGDLPVYYLKVQFKQVDISEDDLDKAFSESDRRALGLAVFLSSLDGLETGQLEKTIVVFDDPVTSFDDHRVGQTHSEIIELATKCEQVIMLSHYKEGIAQFIKTHTFAKDHGITLIEITKDHQSSRLIKGDFESFIRSEHELQRENMMDFVERKTKHLSCHLRTFLEAELALRFGQQIRQHNITNQSLSHRIVELKKRGVVSNETADKLHQWREEFNAANHGYVGEDIENQRTTANRFLKFVFQELVPSG